MNHDQLQAFGQSRPVPRDCLPAKDYHTLMPFVSGGGGEDCGFPN